MVNIAEQFKDLNELKETVVGLVNNVASLTENIKKLTEKASDVNIKKKSNEDYYNEDFDLDKDGKVTPLEIMVVKTLQTIATSQQKTFIKGQKNSLWMLLATLAFLSLQVIFGAFGIQLSF